jgi:hypothetical protein
VQAYSATVGYVFSLYVTSVPWDDVILMTLARDSILLAISTFSRSSLVGSMRASSSGGSTAVSTRVPAAWIAICSGENSRKMQSINMPHAFSASTASGIAASGRALQAIDHPHAVFNFFLSGAPPDHHGQHHDQQSE